MISRTDSRFKVLIVFMSVLLILTSLLPAFTQVKKFEAAGGTVTIYFDTGKCKNSEYGWSKDMKTVYCAFSESVDASDAGAKDFDFPTHDCKAMVKTAYKSVKDPDNGAIFSLTLDSSYAGKYFTLSKWGDTSQKGRYRTVRRDVIKVTDGKLFYDTAGEYNGYEGIWYQDYTPVTDYAGQTYKIANLSDQDVEFTIKYTNDSEECYFPENGATVTARNLGTTFTVPPASDSGTPWTRVDITRKSDTKLIKSYDLTKILGNTLRYCVTYYEEGSTYVDDADGKTLSFKETDYGSIPAHNGGLLYLDSKYFNNASASNYTLTVGNKSYSFEQVTTSGNASFVTVVSESDPLAIPANTIFSLRDEANKVTYNLVWQDSSKNLISLSNGDAAEVSDVRTVQSNENVMPDGTKYMTVAADFFDYQYDGHGGNFDYHYTSKDSETTWSDKNSKSSDQAKAKRPYMIINDAISQSYYGSTTYPMYLGQFWMPLYDNKDFYGRQYNDPNYDKSSEVYTSTTAKKVRAAHNAPGDQYVVDNNNGDYTSNLGFGDILNNFKWTANLAYRTEDQASGTYRPYDAVVQGLVSDTLEGGTANGRLMAPSGDCSIPYFDSTWWTGTVDTHDHGNTHQLSNYLKKYNNLDFPFFEIESTDLNGFRNDYSSDTLLSDENDTYRGKYYEFDTLKHSVYVNTSGNETVLNKYNTADHLVRDNYGSDGSGSDVGLFPFNTKDEGGNLSKDLHYGYGIRYNIDFYLPENGTVDGTTDGTAVTFTFQGDDDVWVFLDGKLLLDMGGAHKNALGEINFKNRKTWISAVANASDASIITNGKSSKTVSFDNSDWASRLTTGEHTITMFYMERGMLNSNLFVMFNLPTNVTAWQLQEDTDFGNVNAGFRTATKYASDNDIFNYKVENKDTTSDGVLGSGFDYPTYEAVTRTNTEAGNKPTAINNDTTSSKPSPEINTVYYTPRDPLLYIDTSDISWWGNDSAITGVYLWNSGEHKYAYKKAIPDPDAGNKLYVDTTGYTEAIVLRMSSDYTTDGFTATSSSDSNLSTMWNRVNNQTVDIELTPSNNTVKVKNDKDGVKQLTEYITNTQRSKTVYDDSNAYNTYNFVPGAVQSGQYSALMNSASNGATVRIDDMYSSNSVMKNTRSFGDNKGIVSLQNGELVTANNQFAAKSGMRITQLNDLSSPGLSNGSDPESWTRADDADYNDNTGRKVSDYYNTYIKTTANTDDLTMLPSPGIYRGVQVSGIPLGHADTMYETGGVLNPSYDNYSDNTVVNLQCSTDNDSNVVTTYNLADPVKATSTNVFLRQVIINSVKTADLRLAKYMSADTYDGTFTFTIKFEEIFGTKVGDSKFNITEVQYTKYKEDGTVDTSGGMPAKSGTTDTAEITLKANQYIIIEGIPIGTKYTINEQSDEKYTLDEDQSVGLTFDTDGSVKASTIDKEDDIDVSVFNKRKTGAIRLRKILFDENNERTSSGTENFELVITCVAPSGVTIGNYTVKSHLFGSTETTVVQWTNDESTYKLVIPIQAGTGTEKDIIIEGIPVGTTYEVSETPDKPSSAYRLLDPDGITYAAGTTTGNVIKKVDAEYKLISDANDNSIDLVTVKNKLNPIIMPETGGTPLIFLLPFGIIALALSGGALVIYKKKLQRLHYHKVGKGRSE